LIEQDAVISYEGALKMDLAQGAGMVCAGPALHRAKFLLNLSSPRTSVLWKYCVKINVLQLTPQLIFQGTNGFLNYTSLMLSN